MEATTYSIDLIHKNGDRKTVAVLDAYESPARYNGEAISDNEDIAESGVFKLGGMILLVFWGGSGDQYEFSVSENKLLPLVKCACQECGRPLEAHGNSEWRAENLDHANLVFSFLWNEKLRDLDKVRV